MRTTPLGYVEAATEVYIRAVFTATTIAPTAASTAVTFSLSAPDGTLTTVSSPNASITGPTAGTDPDNATLVTTTWTYKTTPFLQAGRWEVEAQSTAGILAAARATIQVPAFTPFQTP